jgi:hypothetical protein
MRSGLISEHSIKEALTEAKGDLFLAACALDCTAQELDRYIRRSSELQGFAAAVEQVKRDVNYDRMSAEQFENRCADLTRAYRLDGIETLHSLATTSHGDSAALAKVRLEAAIALRGGPSQGNGSGEAEATLAELNQLYLQNAPRIKEIRQTVVVMDGAAAPIPVTFEQP